jgi:hypothetical protein
MLSESTGEGINERVNNFHQSTAYEKGTRLYELPKGADGADGGIRHQAS